MKSSKPRHPLAVIFGLRVRARRLALKMKQETLARMAGYEHHSNIVKIEKGTALPAFDKAIAIADALGMSLPDLVRPPHGVPGEEPMPCPAFLTAWPLEKLADCVVFLRTIADDMEACVGGRSPERSDVRC